MSASAPSTFTAPFVDHLFDVVRLPAPSGGTDNSVLLAALDDLLDEHAESLAAVIVEPRLQAAGGMRIWDAAALREIRSRTTARDVLLIADEVLTGFGRTGPLFACQGAGVVPDMICLSKGLTGGFIPLGATVVSEHLFSAFRTQDRHQTFFHGHSYTANPLACAAARASLGLLNTACEQRRTDLEADQRRNLARVAPHPWVANPRVIGTIAAFDLLAPLSLLHSDNESEENRGYLAPIGSELGAFALREGVLLRPLGNVVYVMPPYSITAEQLALVYDVIARFLEDLDGSGATSNGTRHSASVSM